jgi:hypothetical protein
MYRSGRIGAFPREKWELLASEHRRLITLQKLRIAPAASFSIIDWTVYVIFIVVIGGVGSFEGPIIGTFVFFLIREYLQGWGVISSCWVAPPSRSS